MLKRKKQYRYLDEKRDKIVSALKSFKDTRDPEHLHKLRIQVKKTMALVRLYKPLDKGKIKPFREVFKHAGLVREAFVQLPLLEKYLPESLSLKVQYERMASEHAEQFLEYIDEYIERTEHFYGQLFHHLKPVKRKKLKHFFRKNIKDTANALTSKISEDELHECRKKIKILLYLNPLLPDKTANRIDLNIAYLDTLQDIIGKWHDAVLVKEVFPESEGILKSIRKLRKSVKCLSRDFIHKAKLSNT